MTSAAKAPTPATKGFSLISAEKLISLYTKMLECRRAEAPAESKLKRGSVGNDAPPSGQEAAIVGTAVDLQQGDKLLSPWSDDFCKIVNTSAAAVRGDAASVSLDLPGDATASRALTLVFVNSQDADKATWRRVFSAATSGRLAIIFVKLNATESSSSLLRNGVKSMSTNGYHLPVVSVDGNDVVAVYRVASEAITHARKGHGPSVIECLKISQTDPIDFMRNYLISKGLGLDPLD